jgi:hypothetical protein
LSLFFPVKHFGKFCSENELFSDIINGKKDLFPEAGAAEIRVLRF